MDADYDDNEITVVKEIPIPPPSPPRDQFGRVRREGVDLGLEQSTTVSQASSYGGSNISKPYGEIVGNWQQQTSPAASVSAGGWQQQQSSGWQQQGPVAMGGWQQQPSPAVGPKFPQQNPILGPARSEGWVGERQR